MILLQFFDKYIILIWILYFCCSDKKLNNLNSLRINIFFSCLFKKYNLRFNIMTFFSIIIRKNTTWSGIKWNRICLLQKFRTMCLLKNILRPINEKQILVLINAKFISTQLVTSKVIFKSSLDKKFKFASSRFSSINKISTLYCFFLQKKTKLLL